MQVQTDAPLAVGALVARFQVHELHPAHEELIEFVCDQHDKVIVVLGLAPDVVMGGTNNPLDLQARQQMVLESYPDVQVAYIKDQPTNEGWSATLDKVIADHTTPSQTVALYGGRDSFVDKYSGKYPTNVLESDVVFSGTVLRDEVSRRSTRKTRDFRAGAIWQSFNRFPTTISTVDVGVWKDGKLLLVRKHTEKLFRLPGGYAMPDSETDEQDARREVQEEAGIAITDPVYVASRKVDDWRYRNERDKIRTRLFAADYMQGHLEPQDTAEIAEAGWFSLNDHGNERVPTDEFLRKRIVPSHHELVRLLVDHRNRER